MAVLAAVISLFVLSLIPRLLRFIREQWHLRTVSRDIPGPSELPVLGAAHHFNCPPNEQIRFVFDLTDRLRAEGESMLKFWFVTRLYVLPLDGATAKSLLDSSEEIVKGSDYDMLLPWLGTGILNSTGEKWRTRRRLLTPTFHFNMLEGYMSTFDEQARILISALDEFVGSPVDIAPFLKRCALDIICQTAMGVRIEAQANPRHPYVVAVAEMNALLLEYGMRPINWLPPVWWVSGRYRRYHQALGTLTAFAKKVIAERRATLQERWAAGEETAKTLPGGRSCFLDMLLDMERRGELDGEDVREEVDTNIFGGHDTTATSVGWALWCLACHPEYQEKARQEVLGVMGNDINASPTIDQLKEMPYLSSCIQEALRLRPPAPMFMRCLQNDLKMGKYTVPKDATVLVPIILIHTNEKVYKDPYTYNPENFNGEKSEKRHPYDFIPFSAGPRNCLGQKFAVLEDKVVLSWFLRRFRVTTTAKFHENEPCLDIVLKPKLGFVMTLERV